MKIWMRKNITNIILVVLLIFRFPISDVTLNFLQLFNSTIPSVSWISNLQSVQASTFYLWERWSFILIVSLLLLNKSVLANLNIDVYFTAILLISAVSYCIYYFWPSGLGAILLCLVFLVSLHRDRTYESITPEAHIQQFMNVIFSAYFLAVTFIGIFYRNTNTDMALHWSIIRLPFVASEEVLFRGILWMTLKDFNFSELKILIIQSVLFWLFHSYYMFAYPILFWVFIPIISMILGCLVWRFKSITPSTIAHTLFNLAL